MVKTQKKYYVLMFAAFVAWVYCFRDFFLYKTRLLEDGWAYLNITKFFFDNILRGVYPIWDPLHNWGMTEPLLNMRFIGEANPFFLFPLTLYALGAHFDKVYFLYAAGYYFFGGVGFYLISKEIFKSQQLAFLAFVLLMFSSTGIAVFFNYCQVVISVPGIWFFYFWMKFSKNPNRKDFLGMTMFLMIIMVTYMPFYFATFLFAFLSGFIILYFRETREIIRKHISFFNRNKIFTCFCIFAIFVATIPGVLWFQEAGTGELVYDYRQDSTESGGNITETSLKMGSLGGIIGALTFEGLFSGLQFQDYNLSYFYLPVIIYPLLLFSFVNRLNRRLVLCMGVSLFMFLIAITDVSGVHKFLYERIFYFKYIRNIFYMLYLVMPLVVLFVVEQLRLFFESRSEKWSAKGILFVFLVLSHGAFYLFLQQLGQVIDSSYLAVGASFLLLSAYALGVFRKESFLFSVLLFAVILIQPLEVYSFYSKNSKVGNYEKTDYRKHRQYPEFSYLRPKETSSHKISDKAFLENSGLIRFKFFGSYWANALNQNVPEQALREYTHKKFLLYDDIELLDDKNVDWRKVSYYFLGNINRAFVSTGDESVIRQLNSTLGGLSPTPRLILEDGPQFKVLKFDLNLIKFTTNFPDPKFLVYNDNFHQKWRATINGQATPILRANVAFKGVLLPPGENTVVFRFGPPWLMGVYIGMIVFFYFVFGWLVKMFLTSKGFRKSA